MLLNARRCAARAADDPERSVHDFRKSIRRGRSIVALLRPALGRTAATGLVEELRGCLRATSDLRDGDVLATTLSAAAAEDPELFVEAAAVAARIGSGTGGPGPAKVLQAAVPVLRRLPAALEVTLPRGYSTPDLEKGLARGYRRAQKALAQAVESRSNADFHTWRKRVKELRYETELLASTGSPPLKAREKALGALAKELGEVTDLAVLCGRIEALGGPTEAGGAGRLLEHGRALVRQRADELLARGQAAFAETPRAFALQVLAERG